MGLALTDSSGLLGVLVHTVHYALTYGGVVVLVGLLLHSRPRRTAPETAHEQHGAVPSGSEHDRRMAVLRAAAAEGRLGVATHAAPRRPVLEPPCAAASSPGETAVIRTWLPVAWVGSAAAAGVHAAAAPTHLEAGVLVGAFFVVAAVCQLGWCILLVLLGSRPWLLTAALVGNAGVALLWLLSRTTGLPGGLGEVEPVGAWDLAATGAEVAVVVGVSLVLRSGRFGAVDSGLLDIVRWPPAARAWLVASVALVLALTVTGAPV